MDNLMTALTNSMKKFSLILTASILSVGLLFSVAHADELKDISQMADQGQGAAAIDRVNIYIAANPKNAQALFMKGVLLAEQGRRDEAIRTFTDVTEKFPNLPEPYNNLAVLYADQGQFDKARKALETVSEIKGMSYTMDRYNERFANDSVHATKFVDRDPDPKADDPILKNYYHVVVGADSLTMVHTWFNFLVRNDFKEVLYYDMKKGKTMPIDDWKKIWPASEFLKNKTD